jgi:hypothetical protein
MPPSQPDPIREFCAHILQLCDYVEDTQVEQSMLNTADYGVVQAKAAQVRKMAAGISKIHGG